MQKPGKVLVYWARGIDNDIKNVFQRRMFKRWKKAGKKHGSQKISDTLAAEVKAKLGLPPSTVLSEAQWYSVSFNPGKWLRDNNFRPAGIFKKIGNFLGKIANVVTKLPRTAALAALAPFKRAMKKELARRKVPVSNKLKDIAQKFFQVVIKKQQAFETMEPVTASILIPAIINFFKMMFNKDEPTAEEEDMIKTADEDLENENELIAEEARLLSDDPDGELGPYRSGDENKGKNEFFKSTPFKVIVAGIILYVIWKFVIKKS